MLKSCFGVALVVLFIGCIGSQVKDSKPNQPDFFIYLSHTRLDRNDNIYQKANDIDFSKYSLKLLGGDLAQYSFHDENIRNHLDDIFDLKSPNTILSIGNHDSVSDISFQKYTNKRKFGLYQKDDVSIVVIDSQDSLSSIVGKQKEFLFKVLDTISTPKVILLSHKLIFMDQHDVMDRMINEVCNAKKGECFHCHNTNNFKKEVYPELLKIRKKGVDVFWIGGDLGVKTTKFEYTDEEGIIFLGNGFWYQSDHNQVLLFKNSKKLTYKFVPIDSLLKHQNSRSFYTLF